MCEYIEPVYCKRCMDLLWEECQSYCDSCGDSPLCFDCLIDDGKMPIRLLCHKCIVAPTFEGHLV